VIGNTRVHFVVNASRSCIAGVLATRMVARMTNAEQILLNVGVLSAVLTLTVTAGIFVTVLLGS
jgi:hypothetical protein